MALIISKASADKLELLCKDIYEGRITFERRGIIATFEPHDVQIIAPCVPQMAHPPPSVLIWNEIFVIPGSGISRQDQQLLSRGADSMSKKHLFHFLTKYRMFPHIFYDYANRLPLADGSFITAPKKYFDCETFDKYLRCGAFRSIYVTSLCTGVRYIDELISKDHKEILIVDIKELHRKSCEHKPRGPFAFISTPHERESRITCGECSMFNDRVAFLLDRSFAAVPKSPFAHFLVEQELIGLRAIAAISAFDMQKIYLIGNDYYASFMPPTQRIIEKLLAGRKRLRFTKKVNEAIADSSIYDGDVLLLASEFGVNAKLLFESRTREVARIEKKMAEDSISPLLELVKKVDAKAEESAPASPEPDRDIEDEDAETSTEEESS